MRSLTPYYLEFTLRGLRRDPVLTAVMTVIVAFGVAILWAVLAVLGEPACRETPSNGGGLYVVEAGDAALQPGYSRAVI